ncbi:MAG TPA: TIGR02679 family protein, partial [Lacipirellulaceae bacterium]|nr:TIGR02679 family protein [Lacipirellulaceae bacterium]
MANSSERDSLIARLRQPDLSRVVARLVGRLRRGRALCGKMSLRAPTNAERRAIAGLSGSLVRATKAVSLDLDALAVLAMRGGRFASLEELVESIHGCEITRQRAEQQASRSAWNQLWKEMIDKADSEPSLQSWLSDPRAQSWIRRLAGGDLSQTRRLAETMFGVLRRLPATTPIVLAQLAADACGDSHALDRDTELGRLMIRAIAARIDRAPPRTAKELRAIWGSAGIVLDEVSATVLVLNLPACPGTPLGDVLGRLHNAGEPCRLTFRQLRHDSPCTFQLSGGHHVFVCENPAVVATAADRWGADCKPLVCVEGQPNLAAERLLHLLVDGGALLCYHGDFDWAEFALPRAFGICFHSSRGDLQLRITRSHRPADPSRASRQRHPGIS